MKITIRWKKPIKNETHDTFLFYCKFEHEGDEFYANQYIDDYTKFKDNGLFDRYCMASYLAGWRYIKQSDLTKIDKDYFKKMFNAISEALSGIEDFCIKIKEIRINNNIIEFEID